MTKRGGGIFKIVYNITNEALIVRNIFALVIGPSSILLSDDPTRYIFL